MSSRDEEQVPSANPTSGRRPTQQQVAERVRLVKHSKGVAPLEGSRQQVVLELIDRPSAAERRSGLDLVAVLDVVSDRMGDRHGDRRRRMDELKTAMKFVIRKLGPRDRLSVVSFSATARTQTLCPLRWASDDDGAKERMLEMVENELPLCAQEEGGSSSNLRAGLETGLSVLAGRQHSRGRTASVILISDGVQEGGSGDATAVRIAENVAVYTFGIGAADQDACRVLEAIAGNSHGGTFYDVRDGESLCVHLSALLAGLLSVVVQDLKLTVWWWVRPPPGDSVVDVAAVHVGSYPVAKRVEDVDDDNGQGRRSVTVISFGDLYSGEVRKVTVDLDLPALRVECEATVLHTQCAYRTSQGGSDVVSSPAAGRVVLKRKRPTTPAVEPEAAAIERIRRRQAEKIEDAIATSDVVSASGRLAAAAAALDSERSKPRHPMLDMLMAELARLRQQRDWKELLAALLASKRSHSRQRFASRGDVGCDIFKLQSMREYVHQARRFQEDPTRPTPPSPPVEDESRRFTFNDDEPPPPNSSPGPTPAQVARGVDGVRLAAYSMDWASASRPENRHQVLLEVTDTSSTADRSALDLVAVLDVSGSMMGEKVAELKTAMKFVICKLSPVDRLSIVTFSDAAARLCPLQPMTVASKEYMRKEIVDKDLVADGGSGNIKVGLETGLSVLAGRRLSAGRTASVVLISDGPQPQQDAGEEDGDATRVRIVGDVAVYTFGIGADQDARVLEAIAGNSHGGTFYDVKEGESLCVHLSALLAGLLSVAVQDLRLIVSDLPDSSTIEEVHAGSYPVDAVGGDDGTRVVVRFGDLHSGEVRKVGVDLILPPAGAGGGEGSAGAATVLLARCTYRYQGISISLYDILRCERRWYDDDDSGAMDPEVNMERVRRGHAQMIEEASATGDVGRAHDKLREAYAALSNQPSNKPKHPLLDVLKAELARLLDLKNWKELLAALLASKRSHCCQRFASRGDMELDIFKPLRMREFVQQARVIVQLARVFKVDVDPTRLEGGSGESIFFPFNDDQQLPPPKPSAPLPGPTPTQVLLRNDQRLRLVAHSNGEAPLEGSRQQVLLEVTDTSSTSERSGLDLVAVLDVSGSSMSCEKLDRLKTAMKSVIKELGPMDRLSVVSFSSTARKLCPLLATTTDGSKEHMVEIIEDDLRVASDGGGGGMMAGLEVGLKIIAGRRLREGRAAAIILMSDGAGVQGAGEGADISSVPVYTFGIGADQDAAVLAGVAANSHGGTFYDVTDGESLCVHLSALLAGLLSVVVQDLRLTVWARPGHALIDADAVHAGAYPTELGHDDYGRSVTVTFGDLYSGEVRRVIVDLLLPAVAGGEGSAAADAATVLLARCTYSTQGRAYRSPLGRDAILRCEIRRSTSAIAGAMDLEVNVERIRLRHARIIEEASATDDVVRARAKLMEAGRALDMDPSVSKHPLLDMLKAELASLLQLTTTTTSPEELQAALLASKRSHETQRFASKRGVDEADNIFKPRRMREHAEEESVDQQQLATLFDEDPHWPWPPPPSVEDSRMEEQEPKLRLPDWLHLEWRPEAIRKGLRDQRRRCSRWWASAAAHWRAVLAVAVVLAGTAVLAMYLLLYRRRTPHMAVSGARLEQLHYGQHGTMGYLQVAIDILAVNNGSRAEAYFAHLNLALGFNGAEVAVMRADPFVVAGGTSRPLRCYLVSAGALDPAGTQFMHHAIKAGVVPFDLFGKAAVRWSFVGLRFWTRMRISCRLHFFPGNGTVVPADRDKCRSRSP